MELQPKQQVFEFEITGANQVFEFTRFTNLLHDRVVGISFQLDREDYFQDYKIMLDIGGENIIPDYFPLSYLVEPYVDIFLKEQFRTETFELARGNEIFLRLRTDDNVYSANNVWAQKLKMIVYTMANDNRPQKQRYRFEMASGVVQNDKVIVKKSLSATYDKLYAVGMKVTGFNTTTKQFSYYDPDVGFVKNFYVGDEQIFPNGFEIGLITPYAGITYDRVATPVNMPVKNNALNIEIDINANNFNGLTMNFIFIGIENL